MVRRIGQFSGIVAVATAWGMLLSAAAMAGFDLLGSDPLSELGSQDRSAGLFAAGLALPAVLLTVFHQEVSRRFPSGRGFSTVMLAGLAGQMVAAVVPLGGPTGAHLIHTTSALVLGASLPLLMWRFAAGQSAGRWRRLCYRLFWAEASACATGLFLSSRHLASLAEILPGAVFHVWVVVVTSALLADDLPDTNGPGTAGRVRDRAVA